MDRNQDDGCQADKLKPVDERGNTGDERGVITQDQFEAARAAGGIPMGVRWEDTVWGKSTEKP